MSVIIIRIVEFIQILFTFVSEGNLRNFVIFKHGPWLRAIGFILFY